MESSGALLYDGTPTLKSKFKYINTATRYSNGAVFPFEGSTDLYPEVPRRLNPPLKIYTERTRPKASCTPEVCLLP